MMTPILDNFVICLSASVEKGISRTAKMSFVRSFKATAALLVMSVSAIPRFILASEFKEQGAMIVAFMPNEPLATLAAKFSSSKNCVLCRANCSLQKAMNLSFWLKFCALNSLFLFCKCEFVDCEFIDFASCDALVSLLFCVDCFTSLLARSQ